ncbi:hypothetical protein FA95DRAFT_825446 [Auriscalpium vulgare]|uniref:Uncharacterized protein n=1 Tax=Auriscalpium vulgare TaxID=40419 RepID=A0ACB8R9I0_9AGAM|nr:hypothetical protein FA95DRAFT_825446 [Auriscalpium vulgare]
MSTLSVSTSSASSLHSAASQRSFHSINNTVPASPVASSGGSFSSSSQASLDRADEENVTITANRALPGRKGSANQEDIQLLAVSTRITELSYSISDIQTRIFEIQELRHKSQSSSDTAATTVIDQSLMALDERLEAVSEGVTAVNKLLEPLLQAAKTPTPEVPADESESAVLLRKHAAFMSEWESVQEESDVLREELKEDKWLTVFRTVTDQADGMMSSLEKAVNRCQDFIWQVMRHGNDDSLSKSTSMASMSSVRSQKSPLSMDVYQSLIDSFEAKKKHYMPATSKVLSIIDKGVQDRVTKNGECLRRHAESTARWKQLRERIARTDAEMGSVRSILQGEDIAPSESGSTTSGPTSKSKSRNGYLTPPSNSSSGKKSRGLSAASTLSRSISPFRKFARKLTGAGKSPTVAVTPIPPKKTQYPRTPSSEPVATVRHRSSLFSFPPQPTTPVTPDRPGHSYSQSLTPDSSPSTRRVDQDITIRSRGSLAKQPWNSSTKIEAEERLAKSRRPSAAGLYGQPNLPSGYANGSPYQRSLSRSSMASSRPWSPVTSSVSTVPSSSSPHSHNIPFQRPASRTQYQTFQRPPSRSQTPSIAGTTRRDPRPQTPSHIPSPARGHWRSISSNQSEVSADEEEPTTLMQRAFSPTYSSPPRSETPGGTRIPHARPPSRSMIPAPTFHFSTPSRPGSAMSDYRPESPAQSTVSSFRSSAIRAQTPEAMLRSRAQQVPFYAGHQSQSPSQSGVPYSTRTARPSLIHKLPPSSFREGSVPRTPSRPASRSGAYTPGLEASPSYIYTPGNPRDPLDAEVAAIVNSIAHGLLIERIDPPLRAIPREGEEIRAQYAFSNALARKIVTCRLTTQSRAGAKGEASTASKKVMVRVGGGWQDLHLYMLNRAAGM